MAVQEYGPNHLERAETLGEDDEEREHSRDGGRSNGKSNERKTSESMIGLLRMFGGVRRCR